MEPRAGTTTPISSGSPAAVHAAKLTMAALAWVVWRCMPAGVHWVRNTLLVLVVTGFSIVVASHIIFGQINTFLMVLCLVDVLRRPGSRFARVLPAGLLVGVAAAIKLTPGLFIVYFLVTKQWRRFWWSVAGAGAGTLLAGALFPEMSWTFFTDTMWHLSDQVDLGGLYATSGNSSIQGALAYFGSPRLLSGFLALVGGAAGLWAARGAYRRGGALNAALIVGLTACLVSPVSWMHHWVYLVPALVLLGTSTNRRYRLTAGTSALVLLATGPHIGDVLLDSGLDALWLPGIIFRESLLIIGATVIVLLRHQTASTDAWETRAHAERGMVDRLDRVWHDGTSERFTAVAVTYDRGNM